MPKRGRAYSKGEEAQREVYIAIGGVVKMMTYTLTPHILLIILCLTYYLIVFIKLLFHVVIVASCSLLLISCETPWFLYIDDVFQYIMCSHHIHFCERTVWCLGKQLGRNQFHIS